MVVMATGHSNAILRLVKGFPKSTLLIVCTLHLSPSLMHIQNVGDLTGLHVANPITNHHVPTISVAVN